jgi:hypothetical protein
LRIVDEKEGILTNLVSGIHSARCSPHPRNGFFPDAEETTDARVDSSLETARLNAFFANASSNRLIHDSPYDD